ncbi:MAG: aspartate kinase [Candidatus Aenigmarchaeota archaeon]|nr:aspartate kinase [Candidatus Aenigmarchaeota archaeon]
MVIIAKFGGTSLKDAKRIKNAATITIKLKRQDNVVVVVSAIGDTTNSLIDTVKNIDTIDIKKKKNELYLRYLDILSEIKTPTQKDKKQLKTFCDNLEKRLILSQQQKKASPEDVDHILGFGEIFSAFILSCAIKQLNHKTKILCGNDNLIFTNANFSNADVLFDKTYTALKKTIFPILDEKIIVFTGFIGTTIDNKTTTLGRSSSDYIASLLGNALDAEEIQIYTDVDGIMTADPRIVKDAKVIKQMDFNEISELAFFGAYVLHPKTIEPAMEKNICVKVINSFNTDSFTKIFKKMPENNKNILSISSKKNVVLLNIYSTRMLNTHGFLARVFAIFEEEEIPIDMVSTSEVNISLSINEYEPEEKIQNIIKKLSKFSSVSLEKNKSIICVVGEALKHRYGIAGKIFTVLGNNKINVEMISQGASEINITFVVNDNDVKKAVIALHDELIK